jgi:hypothetical protein
MLHYWNAFWDLRLEECPCDVHFTSWLAAHDVKGASIFHFGTGGHHHVGIHEADAGRDNAVLGITASPQEYETYVKLVIDRPEVGRIYKVFFGDIYQLDARLLPELDVVALFHLCEFRSEKNDTYGALTDLGVAEVLTGRLRPGGHILFYTRSFAFEAAVPVIAELQARTGLERRDDHEMLQVYRKPA